MMPIPKNIAIWIVGVLDVEMVYRKHLEVEEDCYFLPRHPKSVVITEGCCPSTLHCSPSPECGREKVTNYESPASETYKEIAYQERQVNAGSNNKKEI